MADLTAARAADSFPVFQSHESGSLCVAYGTYTFASNPADATTVAMCKLPAGAVVLDGTVYGADLDTGTEALDIDVGWAATADEVADPDGFGNFGIITGDPVTGTKPETGIRQQFGGVLYVAGPKAFTAPATIEIVINTNAVAGGTGAINVVVYYVVP